MSDDTMSGATGFGKFVPGFDFLQNLVKGGTQAAPGPASWVAPTLDPQELDKRISELKAVQFWLDQNATALKATIQALEVQKMTLATLKDMNLDLASMAQAFKFEAPKPAPPAKPAPAPAPATVAAPTPTPDKPAASAANAAPTLDPMQLWGALSQQFQKIASGAMQEVAKQAAASPLSAKPAATGSKAAASKKAPAKKSAAAKKSAPRSR